MQIITDRPQALTAIRTDLGAIFISLELRRSTWLITSLSPPGLCWKELRQRPPENKRFPPFQSSGA
jgi:hypothetical protein